MRTPWVALSACITLSELFISPRTVEWHLKKVYMKLGISSRKGLGDALPARDDAAAAV